MRLNNSITLLVLVWSIYAQGQVVKEEYITGKIIANAKPVAGVHVLNIVTEKEVVSDSLGFFKILVKPDDLLVFTSVNLEIHRYSIDEEDMNQKHLDIEMFTKAIELQVVYVNAHPGINARALGIIPKNQKVVTAAERGRYSQPTSPFQAIKTMITGKNPALENALKVERNIAALNRLDGIFQDKYYIETLKINKDYIKGFQYYCIEDAEFSAFLKSNNKWKLMFRIVKLAEIYNEMNASH